ncbi:hypothetical protein JCM16303_006380 [Sporobolomyces ruberrimus]
MAPDGASRNHCDWLSMLGVFESIKCSYRENTKNFPGRATPEPRLNSIQEFLRPIWDELEYETQDELYKGLWGAALRIEQAIEAHRATKPQIFADNLPTYYEILEMIAKRTREGSWTYPIPETFFRATLRDFIDAARVDEAYAWRQRVLESKIGSNWGRIFPPAQWAVLGFTQGQAEKIRERRQIVAGTPVPSRSNPRRPQKAGEGTRRHVNIADLYPTIEQYDEKMRNALFQFDQPSSSQGALCCADELLVQSQSEHNPKFLPYAPVERTTRDHHNVLDKVKEERSASYFVSMTPSGELAQFPEVPSNAPRFAPHAEDCAGSSKTVNVLTSCSTRRPRKHKPRSVASRSKPY